MRWRRHSAWVVLAVITLLPPAGTARAAGDHVVVAAGDIACDPRSANFARGAGRNHACKQRLTSELALEAAPDLVLAMGDIQYEDNVAWKYRYSYIPTWGRLKAVTRPAIGNHEYRSRGGWTYFDYFGAIAGHRRQGWYSVDIGDWHIISLNTNCNIVACGKGSMQEKWLRADLAAHPSSCTIAFMHHPRFSSGAIGNNIPHTTAFWQALYEAGAELALAGHDHNYERFAPLAPNGSLDLAAGIRSFVVGTGGKSLGRLGKVKPHSERLSNAAFGVLRLDLHAGSYDWEFVPEPGAPFSDSGSGTCH